MRLVKGGAIEGGNCQFVVRWALARSLALSASPRAVRGRKPVDAAAAVAARGGAALPRAHRCGAAGVRILAQPARDGGSGEGERARWLVGARDDDKELLQ